MRFALVVEGEYLAPWHLDCVTRLRRAASLDAVVTSAPRDADVRDGSRWLRRLAGPRIERTIPIASCFDGVAKWTEAEAALQGDLFDFAMMLGSGSEPESLARLARNGVWRFSHELAADAFSALPFLYEVDTGADTTYLALVSRSAGVADAVLEEGWLATRKRSYAEQLDHVLTSIVEWPFRAAMRLETQSSSVARTARSIESPGPYHASVVGFAARLVARRVAFAFERFFRHPQWNVGVLPVPVHNVLRLGGYADDDIEWFPLAGRRRFLADPFGLESDGVLYVLCEEFPYHSARGHIASLTWPARDGATHVALQPPVHASYPFLIEDGGEIYCVPETAAAGEVALHKAVDFPNEWSKVGVLLADVAGLDPTVFRHDGRWWLMCTQRGRDEDAELYVWHAEQLHGPWTPHARNPVKTDVRSARPGGPPFVHNGVLYRAAQDCSRYYGWRIAIQRIDVLTPTEFHEETVTTLEPGARSRYPVGRHTLTPVGDRVLIDGHRRVFVWQAFRAFITIMARDIARRIRPGAP